MKRKVSLIIGLAVVVIALFLIDWRAIRVWTYKREMANAWNEVVTLGPTNPNHSDAIARTDKYRDLLTTHGHFKYAEFSVSVTARSYDRERSRDFWNRLKSVNPAEDVTRSWCQMPHDEKLGITVLRVWAVPELMPRFESVVKQFNTEAATTQAVDGN